MEATGLIGRAGVQRVPSQVAELYIVRNVFDAQTCAALIERIDAVRRPSTIVDDTGEAMFRTSETGDLFPTDPLVAGVERAIELLTGLPISHAEPLQGQRYAPGQEFKAHTDYFEPASHDFHEHVGRLGNRVWTAMAYLDAPEAGGATRFPTIGKTVHPEPGKLLVWRNLWPNGTPNPETLHHGMKVRAGVKHVLTLWFRERPVRA